MTDIRGTIERLIESARLRVLPGPEENVGAPFDDRMRSVLELLDADEPGVAFENLCSNLHEYDVRMEVADLRSVEAVASSLEIAHERWTFLSELVTGDPPSGYKEPVTIWSVEVADHRDGSVNQLGAFWSELEAQRLIDVVAPIGWGEIRINLIPVHQRVNDWDWDR